MPEPLDELGRQRDRLYEQLAGTGDFRPGSVSETYRRCGKPNCACAAPGHPGHGPRLLWTRSEWRRKRGGRQPAAGAVEKGRGGIPGQRESSATVEQSVEATE